MMIISVKRCAMLRVSLFADIRKRNAMASRYDYRDPGTDPTYCDGLAPDEDTPLADYADTDGPFCLWCDRPLPEGQTDYCDAICVIQAERDNREDR